MHLFKTLALSVFVVLAVSITPSVYAQCGDCPSINTPQAPLLPTSMDPGAVISPVNYQPMQFNAPIPRTVISGTGVINTSTVVGTTGPGGLTNISNIVNLPNAITSAVSKAVATITNISNTSTSFASTEAKNLDLLKTQLAEQQKLSAQADTQLKALTGEILNRGTQLLQLQQQDASLSTQIGILRIFSPSAANRLVTQQAQIRADMARLKATQEQAVALKEKLGQDQASAAKNTKDLESKITTAVKQIEALALQASQKPSSAPLTVSSVPTTVTPILTSATPLSTSVTPISNNPATTSVSGGSSVQGIGGGITVGDIKGLDLETALMAVQSKRVETLEAGLKTQLETLQGRNDQISTLNTQISTLKGQLVTSNKDTAAQLQIQIDALQNQVDGLNNSQQMDMLKMQSLSNKRNEAFDLMTNFVKKMADSRSSILGNMR